MFSAFTPCLGLFFIIFCFQFCCGNYPLLDVDTNMRIVLIPHDVPVGSIIYRLRASDSDSNFPLTFDVMGAIGKTLLELEFLGCSIPESLCQADVILKQPLNVGRTYEFQIRVTDTTGDFTRVKAVITATDGTVFVESSLSGKILRIPENTIPGKMLENFVVSKNDLNTRPVLLEIRDPKGRLELKQKLLSNNRTEGILYLKKELDFEKEPWFTFQLLALNGHTNSTVDTRNVLVSEVAVLVTDVQNKPPRFTTPMSLIELSPKLRSGDIITRVHAEDGDKENKRLIRYGLLSDSNPFVGFFDLNPMTGELRLKRNVTELFRMAKPNEPIRIAVIAEEIVSESSKFSKLMDDKTSTVANLTFWYLEDASTGPPIFSHDKYYGEVKENSPPGTPVTFTLETSVWVPNKDSTIELDFFNSYESYGFMVSPKEGKGNITFAIIVGDSTLLDYEQVQHYTITLKASTSSGLTRTVPVEISLRDVNDNSPIFTQKEYNVEINEMTPYGTKVLQVNATDKDSALFGQVVYMNLVGSDAFRIDPENGMITVDKSMELDRESQSEIRLYVEAKDGGFTEFSDPDFIRNVGSATVVVRLKDVNEPPECEAKSYQAILSPEMDSLKWPVFIKAIDADSVGVNSEVRYQIIGDNRFSIDQVSGQIQVKFPIRFSRKDIESVYLGNFKVRAYDLGVPQMSTECTVQIYTEDVVSQEIGFVFPSSAELINREREKIEKMLAHLTGGHTSIIDVSPFDSTRTQPQLIEKRILGPESRISAVNDEKRSLQQQQQQPAASASDQSVVLVSVQSPISARTRYVDLGSLKEFMITDQIVATPAPATQPEVSGAESRTLFWLLIALILLLLILFLIFLCCLFCPCCYLFRFGKRSEKIEKHTREEFIDTRPAPRRSRKTYPAQVVDSADEVDYNINYRAREAWSGDNRPWRGSLQPRRGGGGRGGRVQQRENMQRREGEDVVVEDWEFAESTIPTQYNRGESRMEELGERWQIMQQQSAQYQPEQQRRRVAYAGHAHPGDDDFVRQSVEVEYDRNSIPLNYAYRKGEVEQGPEIKHSRQRSPTRSLPPDASDYRADSTKHLQTRFYKTTDGEILQLDYDGDGDEGKEMLMRRFISEQHPQGESPPIAESSGRGAYAYKNRQLTPRQQQSKILKGGIVEGFDGDDYRLEQETSYDRPKAASILRRQNVAFESHGREIDKIDEEEDEVTLPIPGSVSKKQSEKGKGLESTATKSRRHHHSHKDKEKGKHEKSRSKRRSRSRESQRSEKSKSRSKSPLPEQHRLEISQPKERAESKSRSHSRSRSPSTSRAVSKHDQHEHKKSKEETMQLMEQNLDAESSLLLQKAETHDEREKTEQMESRVKASESTAIEVISSSTAKSTHDESKDQVGTSTSAHEATELIIREEDDDSGIGLIGLGIANKRSKMLEKKSVFTIAYDEMATQNVLRPDTALNQQELDLS